MYRITFGAVGGVFAGEAVEDESDAFLAFWGVVDESRVIIALCALCVRFALLAVAEGFRAEDARCMIP